MSQYEKAYQQGYIDGAGRSGRREDGGRAGTICISVVLYACTAFAIVASVMELFGLG